MIASDGRPIGSSTSGQTDGDHLLALDGMRGIAALLVMLHHSYWVLGFNPAPSAHLAVDFFFVLSGFVLALATERWTLRGDNTISMLARRVERLWPIYLIGLCLGVLSAFSTQQLGLGGAIKAIVKAGLNAFFIPILSKDGGKLFPFDVPTWSLFFEIVANAFFIVLVRKRMQALAFAVAFSSAMLLACLVRDLGSADGGYDLDTIWVGFASWCLILRRSRPLLYLAASW